MHDARYDPDEMTAYDLPAERSTPVQVRVTATGRGEHPTIAAADYDLRTLPEHASADIETLRREINEHRAHYNHALDTIVFAQARLEASLRAEIERLRNMVQALILRGGV